MAGGMVSGPVLNNEMGNAEDGTVLLGDGRGYLYVPGANDVPIYRDDLVLGKIREFGRVHDATVSEEFCGKHPEVAKAVRGKTFRVSEFFIQTMKQSAEEKSEGVVVTGIDWAVKDEEV